MKKKVTEAIDQAILRLMKTVGAPGVAVAVVQGDEAYTKGYGVKQLGSDDPVDADTLFAGASTTKAFTATAMGILVDDGKVAWDDPVRKHLPHFRLNDPHADALVTLRDLLCHRTGLPRHDMLWYKSPYDRAEILRRIGFAKLTATFRGTYQYNNICYLASGEAIKAASGAASWEAFLGERITGPLGMYRTHFSSGCASEKENHAKPHKKIKGKVHTTPFLDFDNCGPGGTINTSANDIAKWLQFQLAGGVTSDGTRLISEKSLRETHSPHTISPLDEETRTRYPFLVQSCYCLGWALQSYRNGYAYLSHGGAIDGFRSHTSLIPSEKIGISIYVNLGQPFVEMARYALFDILLGLETKDWNDELKYVLAKAKTDEREAEKKRAETRKNRTPCPVALKDLVGEYEDPAYGTISITGKKALTFLWNNWNSPLRHQTYLTFFTTNEKDEFQNVEVKFTTDAAGKVTSLSVFGGEFVKKTPSAPEKGKGAGK
jgi:CubicO group peptidase (beta-lactamase class C family)